MRGVRGPMNTAFGTDMGMGCVEEEAVDLPVECGREEGEDCDRRRMNGPYVGLGKE